MLCCCFFAKRNLFWKGESKISSFSDCMIAAYLDKLNGKSNGNKIGYCKT